MHTHMRLPLRSLATVTLLVLSVLMSAGCEKESTAKAQPTQRDPVDVSVAPVTTRDVQRSVEVVGTLYGDEEATISAKVAGRIEAIYKDVGDRCGPGEQLAQIEKTDYALAQTQQGMAVQESLAKLGLAELPTGEFDPAKVPTVERARLQAHNAESKFRRGEKLFQEKPPLISDQDFADLRTAFDVARSNYDVELLAARSALAEAATRRSLQDLATQRLADTTVRAPAAAETLSSAVSAATSRPGPNRYAVAARLVSVGEYVREGTAMFRLVAADPIKFRAAVPERFVAQVRVGQAARVNVEAYPEVFNGVVARINPQVDLASRTFQVEVTVPNADGKLQPGAFARGSILTYTDQKVVFVPKESVVTFAGVSKVFTVKDGKAVDHTIKSGVELDGQVEIAKGLTADAQVVVRGATQLARGAPVTVGAAAATTTPAAP